MCLFAGLALILAVAAGVPAPMQAAHASVEAATELESVRIGRGDSLSTLLSRAGVSARDAHGIARAIQGKTNLRRLRVGREIRLLFGLEGETRTVPLAVSVETRPGRFVEATRTARGGYKARRTALPLTRPVPLAEIGFGGDGHTVTVRRNETIGGILLRHGVDGETVDDIVRALRAEFDPRDLMPGHGISIETERDGNGGPLLRGIALHLDDDKAGRGGPDGGRRVRGPPHHRRRAPKRGFGACRGGGARRQADRGDRRGPCRRRPPARGWRERHRHARARS